MMRRLKTGAWSVLSFSSRESLAPLERVESLRVKDEQNKDGGDTSDTLLDDGASPIFNVDFFQDARRQVYSESLIFRTTPFYAGKVRLEQRVDEHHLLRTHLAALERSERNGPLLMPDEFVGAEESLAGGSRDPLAATGAAASARRQTGWRPTSYGGAVSCATSAGATGATAARVAGAAPGGEAAGAQRVAAVLPASSSLVGTEQQTSSSAVAEAATGAEGGSKQRRNGDAGAVVTVMSPHAVPAPRRETGVGGSREPARGEGDETGRRDDAETSEKASWSVWGGEGIEETQQFLDVKETSKREQQQRRGTTVKRGGTSRTTPPTTGGGGRKGSTVMMPAAGAPTATESASQRAVGRLLCYTGGEPHILNWGEWIKRQRNRGWFTSETLYYMTIFGAVVGAGDLTTFWSQMQIWQSSMFFFPYIVALFLVGVPTIQLEILIGNLYRGAPVKCFTQLSPWYLGAGLLIFVSNFLRIALLANRSGQLLIYFVASFSTPHPWQLTAKDIETCLTYSGHRDRCEEALHGTLCHYVDAQNICTASSTGKATYYYLSQLQPYTLDPTTNPDALQGKMVGAIAFVWCYILAYIWRGLFKLGFLSAVLMFVAVVLCVTLIFVSFFMERSGGAYDVSRVVMATFDFSQMIDSLGDSRLSAAVVDSVLSDMTLGCGVFTTISSFTKIGYNVAPSGWYTSLLDLAMSTVAFAALLAVVGRLQTAMGISVGHIVAKTGGAASYFVIFPAAFEKVSAPNVFAMFFFGAVFVLNTQVAAIAIHCTINILMEARGFRAEHHKVASVVLVVGSFVFCIPFCCANQQVRVDYFRFLVNFFVIPAVVLVQTLTVGWFHNASIQIRLAGRKAFILYSVLCTGTALVYCITVGFLSKSFVKPICHPLIWNTIFAAIIAATIKEPFAAPRFGVDGTEEASRLVELLYVLRVYVHTRMQSLGDSSSPAMIWLHMWLFAFISRFWALYIGNIESFRHEVCRQTLFSTHTTVPLVWCLKSIPRIFCHCMRSKPFFFCRPSLYWSVAVKHIVPVSMMLLLVHGLIEFSVQWRHMAPSPNLRGAGLFIILLTFLISIGASFLPRRYTAWMCPPPDDYMPIKYFPYHPYKPPVYIAPREAIVGLFREFMRASYRPSLYLTPLLTEYRLHHVRQHQSWEGIPGYHPSAALAGSSALLCVSAGRGWEREGSRRGGGRRALASSAASEEEDETDRVTDPREVVRATSFYSAAAATDTKARYSSNILSQRRETPSALGSIAEERIRASVRRFTTGSRALP